MLITPQVEFMFSGQMIPMDMFRSLTYFESVYGCAAWSMALTAPRWEDWDKIIQDSAKTVCQLRWGYLADNQPHWGAWRKVLVNAGRFDYSMNTLKVNVQSTDMGIRLREKCYERVFKEKTISDMVKKIATDAGLTPDVESTEGKYTLYSCTYDDGAFLKHELLPRAVSSSGRNDFYMYVKNGDTLVFRPPELGRGNYTFRLAPTAGNEGTTPISALRVEYRRLYLPLDGSMSTLVRGFDPLKKVPVFWTANDNTVTYKPLASNKPDAPNKPSSVVYLPEPHGPDFENKHVENRAKSSWSRELHGTFRVALRVLPIPDAEVGSTVDLEVENYQGKNHFLGGNYFVYAIRHLIRANGTYYTVLYLERRTSA